MTQFLIKYKLLIKIFFAIILGFLIGKFASEAIVEIFISVNILIGKLMTFSIPLIIIAFVTKGISSIGKSSGKLLLITLIISYFFMIIASCFSYAIETRIFPSFFNFRSFDFEGIINQAREVPRFIKQVNFPPIMDVFSALILAFIIGIGVSKIKGNIIKNILLEFHDIISWFVQKIIVGLLPLYVVGTFAKLSESGQFFNVLSVFSKLFMVIILIHLTVILCQFLLAGILAKKNPLILIKNIIPAYLSAIATQSSVAVIPINMKCTKENGVSDDINNFVIPLCATIHLSGSIISITSCTMAMMIMTGMPISFVDIFPFILNICVIMVAAPGIPGGAILAAAGVLQSMLGFDNNMISMMITLHVIQDGFGTACNISGDNAIAVIIDSLYNKEKTNKNKNISSSI